MRDFSQAMVETLEGRTMLHGVRPVHFEAAMIIIEQAPLHFQMPVATFTISITAEAPAFKFPMPHEQWAGPGGHGVGRLPGFPKMLPPPPQQDGPAYEAPAHPSTEPESPAVEPAGEPPTISSHDAVDEQPSAAEVLTQVQAKAMSTSTQQVDTSAAEVVDSSGAHKVIAIVNETSKAEHNASAFTALFTRVAAEGVSMVEHSAKLAVAAPVAAVNALPAAAKTLESALSAPQRFFHFERLSNPLALIGDAAAAFAEESALLASGMTTSRYIKAWGITAAVVAFDAAVLMYWMHTRRRSRVVANNWWAFDVN